MNTETQNSIPYGLFRYLYHHYLVRYPDYYRSLNAALTENLRPIVDQLDADTVDAQLAEHSWLIGLARPDLTEAVQSLWASMSPQARGNYLAGYTECAYLRGPRNEAQLSFIKEQLGESAAVDLSPETACQIGCCLLAMKMEDTFADLLRKDIDWAQEIDRATPVDARRWKTLGHLSKRVIDVFLEASLILNRPEAAKLILKNGANPNILIWQLERSSNALYPALSYAINHNIATAVDELLKNGADPSGSELTPMRSPLALAFQEGDLSLIKRLLTAGASLEDGPRYTEAPLFYCKDSPIEWVKEQLSELLGLLPIEAKPIFHSPHAMGGYYYTLLEYMWGTPEKLDFAEEIGMDLRLTVHETARLIQHGKYEAFCVLAGRLGESVKNEALAHVRREWPEF